MENKIYNWLVKNGNIQIQRNGDWMAKQNSKHKRTIRNFYVTCN